MIRRSAPPKRGPVNRVTRTVRHKKRCTEEFARVYGSKKRVQWIASLPCVAAPLCWGKIDNAHTASGGTGRKADAETIVPLCTRHHNQLHMMGRLSFEKRFDVDLAYEAETIAARWRWEGGT